MNTWHLDRLSKEWVGPITVTRNAVPVTGWTYAIAPEHLALDEVGDIVGVPVSSESGGLGILVGPGTDHVLAPGRYLIWIRYVDTFEAPVVPAVGRVIIHAGTTP